MNIHEIMNYAREAEAKRGNEYSSLCEYISHLHSEVSEIFEEHKMGHAPDEIYYQEHGKERGIPSELADVIILSCTIASKYNIDLDQAIKRKLSYNLKRDD